MASHGRQSPKPFNGKKDTKSRSAREAFSNIKDQNGIGRCQSPDKHPIKIDDENNPGQKLTEYQYTNIHGGDISIRKDNSMTYSNGQTQGPYFNAGPTGGKLEQHHNY